MSQPVTCILSCGSASNPSCVNIGSTHVNQGWLHPPSSTCLIGKGCDGRSVIFALKIIFKEINHINKISIGFTLTSQFPGKFFSGYLISALNKPQGKPVHVQYLQQNKEVLKTIV